MTAPSNTLLGLSEHLAALDHIDERAIQQAGIDPLVAAMLNPGITAGLVIDVTKGYCEAEAPLPKFYGATTTEADATADRIDRFIGALRQLDTPLAAIIFIRMYESPETLPAGAAKKMIIEGRPVPAEPDGPYWAYHKVKPEPKDPELVKFDFNAFTGTRLDKMLQNLGVETLIAMGMYRSVCLNTTVMGAAALGYNVIAPPELSANLDPPGGIPPTAEVTAVTLRAINVVGHTPHSSAVLDAMKQY